MSADAEPSGVGQDRRQIENICEVACEQTDFSDEELDEILDAPKMTGT